MPEQLYELWLAYPNRADFVRTQDHSDFAKRPGWWCADQKLLNLAEVLATGHLPYEVITT